MMAGFNVGDDASPGDMFADDGALVDGEEAGVAFVGEDGEESFYVGDFATQSIGDADDVGGVGLYEGCAFNGAGDNVVDEDAAVDEIDFGAVGGEGFAVIDEVARISEQRWHAEAFEAGLQD